jgi:hypothetical protein
VLEGLKPSSWINSFQLSFIKRLSDR